MAEGTPMSPDRDNYRSAQVLVKHHVEGAPIEAVTLKISGGGR